MSSEIDGGRNQDEFWSVNKEPFFLILPGKLKLLTCVLWKNILVAF